MQDIDLTPIGYISAVESANRFGLTNDHVASLVRKGKVEGILLGRVRYLKEESLKHYLAATDVERVARQEQLSKQIRSDYIAHAQVQKIDAPVLEATHVQQIFAKESTVKNIRPAHLAQEAQGNSQLGLSVMSKVDPFAPRLSKGRVLATRALGLALLFAMVGTSIAYAGNIRSTLSTVADAYTVELAAFVGGTHATQSAASAGYQTVTDQKQIAIASAPTPSAEAPTKIIEPSQTPQTIELGSKPQSLVIAKQVVAQPVQAAPLALLSGYVTKDSLTTQLDQLSNGLKQLIYQNAGTVGQGQYSSGGSINNLALSTIINKLNNVTINGASFTGTVSGLTAASIPSISLNTGVQGLLGVDLGGTGLSALPAYGQVLLGNSAGGYDLVATSSLGIVSGTLTSIGPAGQLQTGPSVVLATSTLGSDFTITASGNVVSFNVPSASLNSRGLLNIADFVTFNNKISSTSLSATYPLAYNSSTGIFTTAFGTTTANTFSQQQTFTSLFATNASTTNATTTNLHITGLTNSGLAVDANGKVYAAATSTLTTISGTLAVTQGGTGITSTPTFGTILVGNNSSGYSLLATSSLGLFGSSSLSASAPLSFNSSTGAFSISQSGTGSNGYLSQTDFSTFNNKISSTSLSGGTGIGYVPSTGVITNTGVTSLAATYPLQTSGATGALTLTTAFGTTTANTFSQLQTLSNGLTVSGATSLGNVTALNSTSTQATTTSFAITSIASSLLKTLSSGAVVAATAGTDYATPAQIASSYEFQATGNATGTLTQFNGGLTAYASSTIGNGTLGGGLTINGGATTTGNAYFASNVGVGTTSPWQPLTVRNSGTVGSVAIGGLPGAMQYGAIYLNGSQALNDYNFASSPTDLNLFLNRPTGKNINFSENAATQMTLLSGGNLGIGTTSPPYKLSVSTSALLDGINIDSTNLYPTLTLSNSGAAKAYLSINKGGGGWGSTLSDVFIIRSENAMQFETNGGNPQMTIDTSGNVGIGVTSPIAKLDVNIPARTTAYSAADQTTWSDIHTWNPTTSSNAATGIAFELGSAYNANAAGGIGVVKGSASDYDADMVFITRPLAAVSAERMRITSAGNVGIGTTTPATGLSVAGNGYFTGGVGVGKVNTAANTIDVAAGGAYRYNSTNAIIASTTLGNFYFANSGNTTGTGTNNVSFGGSALSALTSGANNVAGGLNALSQTTSGGNNAALGTNALNTNTTGSYNTVLGTNALYSATSTSYEVAIGFAALNSDANYTTTVDGTAQNFNTAVGAFSLYSTKGGLNNVGLGYSAAQNNTTGSSNVAIGSTALYYNQGGSYNIGIGDHAIFASGGANTYSGNVAIGFYSGSAITTGGYNTFIGNQAGGSITSGSSNVVIGQFADVPNATANGQLNIGNVLYGTGLYNTQSLSSSPVAGGMIGIGTTSPAGILETYIAGGNDATAPKFFTSDTNSSEIVLGSALSNYKSGFLRYINGNGTAASASLNLFNYGDVTGITLQGGGNVGIGTTTPATTLSVAGNGYFTGGVGVGKVNTAANTIDVVSGYKINGTSGSSATVSGSGSSGIGCAATLSGSFVATGGLVTGTTGYTLTSGSCPDGDIAERYGTDGALPVVRGDIVALSPTVSTRSFNVTNPAPGESTSTQYTITTSNVHVATTNDRQSLLGIIPTSPFIIGADVIPTSSHPQPVGLTGHAPVHMTLDGGPVAIGDPITISSSTPGYGMKATTPGRIIGYALAAYTAPNTGTDGSDMVEVFIHVEEWQSTSYIASTLRISGGVIDLSGGSATTAVAVGSNVWSIATSTATGTLPIISISTGTTTTSGTTPASVSINGALFVNGVDIAAAVASSSATTTPAALLASPLAGASDALKGTLNSALGVLQNIVQSGVRQLGAAVYASVGVFNNLFAQTITVTDVNADTVNTNKLCIQGVCVTKDQLQNLLSGQTTGSGSTTSSTTPPTITLNGANPATVSVGDTYADLGGTISGPGTDNNLTLMASVDGAATTTASQISIDTTATSTHSIIYSATDGDGNVGYATRTVVVQ